MKSFFSCVAVAALSIGCSGNDSDPTLDPVNVPVLLEDLSFSVLNQERRYHLYLPRDPDSASIVLLLHGNGGSNDQLLGIEGTKAPFKLWLDVARQENLILVVPNGSIGSDGRRGWNDCRNDVAATPESDDVQYIRGTDRIREGALRIQYRKRLFCRRIERRIDDNAAGSRGAGNVRRHGSDSGVKAG